MNSTPKGKTQNPLNNKKNNGFSYSSSSSSSSTLPSKPISHYKAYETPSSSSLTIPVPKQKGPSAASETNTINPSLSEVGWAFTQGAGKLAFFVGKAAAIVATGVVKGVVQGGIEIARNQIEHNEKLKETERNEKLKETERNKKLKETERNEKLKQTFSCYYTNRKKIIYQGTLYFSDYQIVFSTNHHVLPTHTTSCFLEKEAPNPKVEIEIPFGLIFEIHQVNAENPSNRARGIKIRALDGSYGFWGFDDYDKAYNTICSLKNHN